MGGGAIHKVRRTRGELVWASATETTGTWRRPAASVNWRFFRKPMVVEVLIIVYHQAEYDEKKPENGGYRQLGEKSSNRRI